jgi:dipeptidase E
MKKTIIAVGGGSYGQIKTYPDGRQVQKNKDSIEIDKKMIKLTGKEHPKIVFIGAAHGDDESRFLVIKKYFSDDFGCEVENLNLVDDSKRPSADNIKKIILGADIIYVGGGNVTYLMNILKKTGVDNLLIQAYNQGIIMAGNSAGGCVWFEYYGNDEDDDFDGTFDTFKPKKALGLVHGYFEPHWNEKPEEGIDKDAVSRNAVQRMLSRESKFGYGVDEGAAIMVQTDANNNQTITEIISKPGAKIYKLCFPQQQHINTGKGRE